LQKEILGRVFLKNQGRFLRAGRSGIIGRGRIYFALYSPKIFPWRDEASGSEVSGGLLREERPLHFTLAIAIETVFMIMNK
jgi:hypothetical protein